VPRVIEGNVIQDFIHRVVDGLFLDEKFVYPVVIAVAYGRQEIPEGVDIDAGIIINPEGAAHELARHDRAEVYFVFITFAIASAGAGVPHLIKVRVKQIQYQYLFPPQIEGYELHVADLDVAGTHNDFIDPAKVGLVGIEREEVANSVRIQQKAGVFGIPQARINYLDPAVPVLVPVPPVQAAEAVGKEIGDIMAYIVVYIDDVGPHARKLIFILKIISDVKHVPLLDNPGLRLYATNLIYSII